MAIKELLADVETYSGVDLGKCGVYKYVESPDFDILLFGYSADGGEVTVVDLACGEQLPEEILDALTDDSVTKWIFNSQFERICISAWLRRNYPDRFVSYSIYEDTVGDYLDPSSWKCLRVWSAYLGLPLSLEAVGEVLGLEKQKLTEGKELISYFCKPCSPTKSNGGRSRNLPENAPDKWEMFKRYNRRDVEAESSIQRELHPFPVPDFVWEEYWLDQEINDRGVAVDMDLVETAIRMDGRAREKLTRAMKDLTGVDNPNSVQQMKRWLSEHGLETDTLGKKQVTEMLKTAPSPLKEVLTLRQQLAKSSVKKYTAMENATCADGRARGMFQFYGANRSGRWSSRLVQLQNLPRNSLPDLEEVRALVKGGDYETLEALYDDVPDTLSQLVRTAFIPRRGYKLVIADFSSIEARVLSWLAGEQWRMDVFAEGKDIYCMSASQMFHKPVEKHGQNAELRQKGKIAELACIARNSLVLTDRGLIPIQYVTKHQKVWDGLQWVSHDGVVFRGFRRILHYDGLSATEDHLVYVEEQPQPVRFGDAVQRRLRLRRKSRTGYSDDFYTGFAPVYDILNTGRMHKFTVSGCLVHNCGYGGSVGALKAMGALEMGLAEEELHPLVDAWRESNPSIVRFWRDVDRAATEAVRTNATAEVSGIQFSCRGGMLFITLPSGRRLCYVKPRIEMNRFGGECITYEGIGKTKKWERMETYGPRLVENCLAGDTLVLTDKGLVPITNVTMDSKVWDGEEWVSHDGVIDQGIRETVKIGGLRMTPEHRILTEKGWMPCVKAEGFNWATVSLPDGFGACRGHEAGKTAVVMPMRMREASRSSRRTSDGEETSGEIVWMYDEQTDQRIQDKTWYEPPSGVRSMAFHEATVRGSQSPRIPQLWGSWDNRVPGVEREFRGVLEGHGAIIQKWFGTGPDRQQPRLQTGKLSMDDEKDERSEQEDKSYYRDAVWQDDNIGAVGADRDRGDDAVLPTGASLAGRIAVHTPGLSERVYDIRNCGPRHRFAVYDQKSGEIRLVSNCTQAISRDLLAHAMQTLSHCFIVMHVHDELVLECGKDVSVDAIAEQMGRAPAWAKGLNLRADGYEAMFYRKE